MTQGAHEQLGHQPPRGINIGNLAARRLHTTQDQTWNQDPTLHNEHVA
jgi:hypothetical protein